MKTLFAVLICAGAMAAQTLPNEFLAVGAAWDQAATPAINGWGSYGKQLAPEASPKTYSYTTYDIFSKTLKPFTVTTSVRTGVCQVLAQWGKLTAMSCADAGIAAGGSNAGYAVSAEGLGAWQVGKHLALAAAVREIKSSLADRREVYSFGLAYTH